MTMVRRRLAAATMLLALLCACPDRPVTKPTKKKATAARPKKPAGPALVVNWDAKSGRGHVIQILDNGDRLRAAFHEAFPGYTGGLIIGSLNGSGYGLAPARPIRGYRRINVFCAQDESIWDHAERAEYTYGWSENYGTGKDGKRLEFQRGEIVERGPRRVIMRSENAGGCYRVAKVAYTRLGVPWWIIATRITNGCERPIRFDFFSGDDPWIGLYRSSDGDVGWTPEGLVRRETALGPGRFTAGGFYDLGNEALGQKEGSFSNQANFVLLDPVRPLPDLTLFANRFAHAPDEIDPERPLDNKSLTALNMGWRDLALAPGASFTTAMALGLARTGKPGEVPTLPQIGVKDWSVWRRYLREGAGGGIVFAAERIELDLTPNTLRVRGTYHLHNRDNASTTVGILYPILTGPDRPAPASLLLDGKRIEVSQAGKGPAASRFQVHVPPLGLARFVIDYTQEHRGRQAGYMVTSALRWSSPITRAVFVVRHPKAMNVRLGYKPDQRYTEGDRQVQVVVRQPFVPRGEMTLRW